MEQFIELSEKSRIRVAPNEYKGHKGTDIRKQFKDENGKWQFTSKGILIPQEHVPSVVKLLKSK